MAASTVTGRGSGIGDKEPPVSRVSTTKTLISTDSGITLDTIFDTYFIVITAGGFSVNLPDPSLMTGRILNFIMKTGGGEFGFTLVGSIDGGSNFGMNSRVSVSLCSDGTGWYIVSFYED